MIPAILTCIYVVYLYRKLNTDTGAGPSTSADRAGNSDLNQLADRLNQVETRLRNLTGAGPATDNSTGAEKTGGPRS